MVKLLSSIAFKSNLRRYSKMYSYAMPNALNVAFDYPTFLCAVLLIYPIPFYSLYGYMFAQRKKKLGSSSKKQD
jgi:very-long-chain (3R)-3-hydroxyacyl-CoA dehydratase